MPKSIQQRRIDLGPTFRVDVRILNFFSFFSKVRFWEFSQKAQIFLKFVPLTNSTVLNNNLASDSLFEAAIIFYELTYSNFKKNNILRWIRFLRLNHLNLLTGVFFFWFTNVWGIEGFLFQLRSVIGSRVMNFQIKKNFFDHTKKLKWRWILLELL